MTAERHALVIVISEFDSVDICNLPGAKVDGDKISAFAKDPKLGSFNNVCVLENATLQQMMVGLADLYEAVGDKPGSLAFVFIATHGCTVGPNGLWLVARDSQLGRRTTSMLSLEQIAALIEEYRPHRSIIVIDACEAGGHTSSAATIARDKLWRDLEGTDSPEGHFFLVACGTTELADEDSGTGGVFTTLVLDALETEGKKNPDLEWIPADRVASVSVRNARELGAGQAPEWSGLAVSVAVDFCRNPHFDASIPISHRSISLEGLDIASQSQARRAIRCHWNALNLIGTETDWLSTSQDAVHEALQVLDHDDALSFLDQAIITLWERVSEFGGAIDRLNFARFGQFIVTESGKAELTPHRVFSKLLPCLADIAASLERDLVDWEATHGWFVKEDGPAGITTTSIRFWDRLGLAAFLATVSRTCGAAHTDSLAGTIARIVRDNVRLHRIVWMGQYTDLASTLSVVATFDSATTLSASKRCLERLLQDYEDSRPPVPSALRGSELGRSLAQRQLTNGANGAAWMDEGPATLLCLMQVAGASAIELNAHGATLVSESLPTLGHYQPTTGKTQYQPIMRASEPLGYPATEKGVAELLAALVGASIPYTGVEASLPELQQVLISMATASHYRNRSSIASVSTLVGLW